MKPSNVKQNKRNKQMFWSPLLNPLKKGITKAEGMSIMGCGEREVRNEISLVAMFYPVITYSSQNKMVYRIASNIEEGITPQNLIDDADIDKTLAEFNSRIKAMKKRMKPLIAWKKILEKQKSKYKA